MAKEEDNIIVPEHEIQANMKFIINLSKKIIDLKSHLSILKKHRDMRLSENKTTDLLIQDTASTIRSYTKRISKLLKHNYPNKFVIPDEFWLCSKDLDNGFFELDTTTDIKKMVTLPEGLVLPESLENDQTDD